MHFVSFVRAKHTSSSTATSTAARRAFQKNKPVQKAQKGYSQKQNTGYSQKQADSVAGPAAAGRPSAAAKPVETV